MEETAWGGEREVELPTEAGREVQGEAAWRPKRLAEAAPGQQGFG